MDITILKYYILEHESNATRYVPPMAPVSKLLNIAQHYIITSDRTTSLNLVQKPEGGTPSLHAKREYCMVQYSTIVHVRGMAIPSLLQHVT